MTDFREVTPLSGDPVRTGSATFLPDVVKLRDAALERYESLEAKTQIAVLTERIAQGETWISENRGKVSAEKLDAAKKKLAGLKSDRAKMVYNVELPYVLLDSIADLLQRTTTLGAQAIGIDPGPGAYIRVVLPGITTFEADIVLPDIPF